MTADEAFKTLTENICQQCAYGARSMDECDIRGCDNRDAIKALKSCCNEKMKGKWIKGGYCCGETEWICPRCNASEWRTNRVPFCPWCGNPMEVDE